MYMLTNNVFFKGILLWELWTGGKTPYPAFTNPQVLDEVLLLTMNTLIVTNHFQPLFVKGTNGLQTRETQSLP